MSNNNQVDREDRPGFAVYIAFSLFIAFGAVLIHFIFEDPEDLAGPDCYVRLTRVTDLYETGHWYEPARMKTNTPYGDTLPWGRPFDVLLLAGAVPLSQFMDFESALWWWGIFISPVLLVIALVALHWASKPLLTEDAAFFVVFILALQFGVIQCFKPARPDHHSLQALLFIVLFGVGLRMVMHPFQRSLCWWGGAVAALAVSTSIESCVITGLITMMAGAFWVFQQKDVLQKNVHYCGALCLFAFVALLLERPPSDITTIEFDRISIVYVFFFGLMAGYWAVVSLIDTKTSLLASMKRRLCWSLSGVAAIAFLMWLLFPKFYKGPLADVDPRIYSIWFSYISELQPLVRKTESLIPFIQTMGPSIICLIFIGFQLSKVKKLNSLNGWILTAVLIVVFSFHAFRQIRWLVYPQILLSVVMAELLYSMINRLKGIKRVLPRALAKSAVISLFSIGFMALGFGADWVFGREESEHEKKSVSLIPICSYLNEKAAAKGSPFRILTENNFASEILYRTDCEVVGSNYHRNGQGIIDNHIAFTAEADEVVFDILSRREIEYLILQKVKIPTDVKVQSKNKSTFSMRLREGNIPGWLMPVELPEELAEDFLMFETDLTVEENTGKPEQQTI